MNISQVATQTGLSIHTLRYYEKEGILKHIARDQSGHRYYTAKDLEWLSWITRLKSTGMSLRHIKKFAELRDIGPQSLPARRDMLAKHATALRHDIVRRQAELDIVEYKIKQYSKT